MTYTAKTLFPRAAFVGFDQLFDELDAVARHATDSYPPHSILKTSDTNYLIELAVAGFKDDELSITVEDRTLTVKGQHKDQGRQYIHKGISTKKFERKFRLSEYVEVAGADLQNGILAIQLEVVLPEEKRPKVININTLETKNDYNSNQISGDSQPELLLEEGS